MKSIWQSCFIGVTAVMTAVLPALCPTGAWAQTAAEPAVVVSIASINDQLSDIDYITKTAKTPGASMIRMQAEGFLRGVDKTKPIGTLIYFKDDSPEPDVLLYVPVKNYDDLLDNIGQFAEIDDEQGFNVIHPPNDEPLYVKNVEGFAVASPNKALLDTANANISDFLGDLPTQYNMSARIFAQRIPENMRQEALDTIEKTYRQQMEQMAEDDLTAELQLKNFEMQMKQMRSLINETDQLVIGLDADKDGKNIHMDLVMTGLDGSVLAKQSQNYSQNGVSAFSGFLMEGATFTANMHGKFSEEDQAQYKSMINDFRKMSSERMDDEMSPAEKAMAEEFLNEFFQVAEQTIGKGVMDGGMSIVLDDNNANAVLGCTVASPQALEAKIKDLAKEAQKEAGDQFSIKLDCDSLDGVSFHEITVPVPDDEEELHNLVGDTAKFYLGFGKDVVYMAVGNDPMDLMRKAMAESSQGSKATGDNSFMQYNLYLAPLLNKIGSIQEQEMMKQAGAKLKELGRDRVRFSANTVHNGFNIRIEVQDGFLELITMLTPMLNGGADF